MRLKAEKAATTAQVRIAQSKLLSLPCGKETRQYASSNVNPIHASLAAAKKNKEKTETEEIRRLLSRISSLVESVNVLSMLSLDINHKLECKEAIISSDARLRLNQQKNEIGEAISIASSTIELVLSKVHNQVIKQSLQQVSSQND